MTNQRLHIFPIGVPEPLHHINENCWCSPLITDSGRLAIHHAKDGREKWERQGIINRDKLWCSAYEDLPEVKP